MGPPGEPIDFTGGFRAVTAGLTPFPWQRRLFERFTANDIPFVCRLPTGLGKTAVMSIWLIALASRASLPRRLIYVVNRRTVVDQATDCAAKMLQVLQEPSRAKDDEGHACRLRDALAWLSGDAGCPPLAVSTLRGELADNGEWKKNPARPAIVIGTIDMIGSKLLFSGYGDGRYSRVHHAGLVGQGALLVHDEAHLSPAFDQLLRSVAAEQARCREPRQIRVMSLSATTRSALEPTDIRTFGLADEDLANPVVKRRLTAGKRLRMVSTSGGNDAAAIASRAVELGAHGARVLVYVRSPESAKSVRDSILESLKLRAKDDEASLTEEDLALRVGLLTGTIRGYERDQLVSSDLFRAFQSTAHGAESCKHERFLVSTSAGEVGADWDADHLVCDLTTLESMAQRFGRVNRLGVGSDGQKRESEIVVFHAAIPDQDPLAAQLRKTADALKTLPELKGPSALAPAYDASPASVSALLGESEAQSAFAPAPTSLSTTDILFDYWSLTTIAGEVPGRPEVAPFLHGVADWEPPVTHVAWRADIALLAAAGGRVKHLEDVPSSTADLEAVFETFPLRAAEQLRDRTDRVQEQLAAIAERLSEAAKDGGMAAADSRESGSDAAEPEVWDERASLRPAAMPADPWVVLMRGSSVRWVRLSAIAPSDRQRRKRAQSLLAFATIVLPVEAGGLRGGMLDGKEQRPDASRSLDVAEAPVGGSHARQRVVVSGEDDREVPLVAALIQERTERLIARHAVILSSGDGNDAFRAIEYRIAKGEEREPGERVGLHTHNAAVAACAERMALALGLDDSTTKAITLAARWHDAGKARPVWQRFARNWPREAAPGGPIAKSAGYLSAKALGGYRHEFGSLHDAAAASEVQALESDTRDLVLHLIAAHHGWARPHFEERAFDNEGPLDPATGRRPTTRENETAAIEVMQRFGRLQQRFGRWGLAWLESILRCADAAASSTTTVGAAQPRGSKP